MDYYDTAGDLFVEGEWFKAMQTFFTTGGDPTLQMLVPAVIYSTILVGYFIVGSSPLIPVVITIIFAGVIFVGFPASALQIIVLTLITTLAVAGLVMTWRFGR